MEEVILGSQMFVFYFRSFKLSHGRQTLGVKYGVGDILGQDFLLSSNSSSVLYIVVAGEHSRGQNLT